MKHKTCYTSLEYFLATDKMERSHLNQENYLSLQSTDDFLALPVSSENLEWQ